MGDKLRPVSYIKRDAPAIPTNGRPAVAVAFSGGGFRASLAGMGVIRALADAELLGNVRYSSSVSGGCWPNAILALRWRDLEAGAFGRAAADEHVIAPFVHRISTESLTRHMLLNSWRVIGPTTRTDLLAHVFEKWFGNGRTLGDLPPEARWLFSATNLTNGARFEFDRQRVGDYQSEYIRAPDMAVSEALGASASIPGALATQRLRAPHNVYSRDKKPKLVDGAVYDNLGLEPLLHIGGKPLIVVLDAGAPIKRSVREKLGVLGSVKASSKISARQTTTLRKRWFIEKLRTWEEWEANNPEDFAAYLAWEDGSFASAADKKAAKGDVPQPPKRSKRGVIFSLGTSMDPTEKREVEVADEDGTVEIQLKRTKADIVTTISKHQTYQPDPTADELPPWRLEPLLREVESLPAEEREQALTNARQRFRDELTEIGMSAGKFDIGVCDDLVYRGWWLTRENLRTFHPEVIPAGGLPAWTPYR